MMHVLFAALRGVAHTLRRLRQQAAPSILALLTMLLASAGITAIGVLFDTYASGPSGVRQPDRVVEIARVRAGNETMWFSYPEYLDLRSRFASFDGMAAYARTIANVRVGDAEAGPMLCALVSENYFSVLGVSPSIGRVFDERGDGTSPRTVILSNRVFRQRFAGDRSLLGSTLVINRETFVVIGILPADFRGTIAGLEPDLWMPITAHAAVIVPPSPVRTLMRGRDLLGVNLYGWVAIIGRLGGTTTLDQARAELSSKAGGGNSRTRTTLRLAPLTRAFVPPPLRDAAQKTIALLAAMSGLFLAVSVLNTLLLLYQIRVRREREMAVRLALGQGRAHLALQLLFEGFTVVGTVAALGAALVLGYEPLAALAPELTTPVALHLHGGWRTITLLAAEVAVGGVLWLVPYAGVLMQRGGSIRARLESAGPASSRPGLAAGGLLVLAQVLLAVTLVGSAVLLALDLRAATGRTLAFDPASVLVVRLNLDFSAMDGKARQAFYRTVLDDVRAMPGVTSAALTQMSPLAPPRDVLAFDPRPQQAVFLETNRVSPGYLDVLNLRLLAGRWLSAADSDKVVLNESYAVRSGWLPTRPGARRHADVLGRISDRREVVGVVGNTVRGVPGTPDEPMQYVLFENDPPDSASIILRHTISDRRAKAALDGLRARLPLGTRIDSIRTMREHLATANWRQTVATAAAAVAAVLALVLAAIGTLAVASHAVTMRQKELSIKSALGAPPSRLARDILGRIASCVAVGAIAGMLVTTALRRVLDAVLTGLVTADVQLVIGAGLFCAFVSVLAASYPAMRAIRTDAARAQGTVTSTAPAAPTRGATT